MKNNTTGAVTSTEGGTGNTASATLTVLAPPSISKAFGAPSIDLGGTTTLAFTITNPNATTGLSGVAFLDALPGGLVVATPNGLGGTCAGTITANAGSSSISLSSGTLAASASCSFTVNVTGTSAGVKNNTTGVITSIETGPGGLTPGATYYFRAAASNSAGTTEGSILSFRTSIPTQVFVTQNFPPATVRPQ